MRDVNSRETCFVTEYSLMLLSNEAHLYLAVREGNNRSPRQSGYCGLRRIQILDADANQE